MHKTSQRKAILRALEEAPGPLTPQEVHESASRHHPGLGLATVYRNLGALAQAGAVTTVRLPNETTTRYAKKRAAHPHPFSCEECGRVYELDATCPVAVLEGATLPGGFRVRDHSLTLYGYCPDCAPS